MKYYLSTAEEVLQKTDSCAEGISEVEASARLERDGQNKLAEGKKQSWIARFFSQLCNPMIIVLLIAAAVNFVTVLIERIQGGDESFAECIIILVVVLLNALLGVIQEGKAEQAVEALKQMTASTCKVLRDGKLLAVKNEDVVVGDVVILEAGDSVPADCRILECASLKVEEAALTGESVPSEKDEGVLQERDGKEIPLGDRKNMLYMGSVVVYGRATAVVVATGMQTEMGKIAGVLTATEKEVTPLQKKLNSLSKILSFVVLGISAVIFAVTLIKGGSFEARAILDGFIIAVSLAVAAIPEGLATVVTIVLSLGMTKMAKNNAVVKRLTAVETLGCTQIICSDKTGTLTQNKMTVVESVATDEGLLARAMAQCSDAVLDEDTHQAKGEPTEAALVNYAFKVGLNKTEMGKEEPRVEEAPFDSMRKMMTTVHKRGEEIVQYTKGAPDEILKRCTQVWVDGKVEPMTEEKRAEYAEANKAMADKALRVLACAYKQLKEVPVDFTPEDLECDMIFVGMVGMIDPIRPEVKDAIALCKSAGIRPVMITGDHIDTAVAIAIQLGIIEDKSQAITGSAMAQMGDEEFEEKISQFSVYARVQPEHKVRIVNTWKKKGYITAMTGDGVNDAPSIKSADIGIGMGITGTDVTKSAADMVLQDDNFATIVSAVGEGRRIYDNIRKTIQFLLSSNLAEVVAVFIATLCGWTLLKPMHLLWINLIGDTLPAIALGMEEGESDLMEKEPRKPTEGVFAGGLGLNVALQGCFIGLLTLVAFIVGVQFGGQEHGMTMAFLTLSLTETFHAFNVRSLEHSLFESKKTNKLLWLATLAALVLTAVVVYVPPIANLFGFTAVGWIETLIAVCLSLMIFSFVETQKLIKKIIKKRKKK